MYDLWAYPQVCYCEKYFNEMKRVYLFLMILCAAVSVIAAPAYRKSFTVKQSDGSELSVILTGDESFHYHMTLDGKPLLKEADGDFVYASFSDDGRFVSTNMLAHNKGMRGLVEESVLASMDYGKMKQSMKRAAEARSATYKAAAQRAGSQIKPEGDVNIAVVLVQFKDQKFTYTKEDIDNVLNAEGYSLENPFVGGTIGSARDYFIAQSDGKFRPNFIVTDIVTLDNNMSYYGGNDANGNDKKASYAVKEGIQKADATFDFSKCDNDGDGEVEFVYCIYAGYSESYGADENTIWPHQWELRAESGSITVDGVKCNTYACSGELVYSEADEPQIGKVLAGIGLICHEFSHCLGLHDIYDTSYESGNWAMDYWDVMDQGNYAAEGYCPVGYSAYQRDFCGWRELVEIDARGEYSMEPLTQGGIAYKVVNDANKNEYYILENRKQEGWDTYLFNEGMLIIHVDYLKSAWDNNTINNTKGHPRYTLIPADGELAMYGEVSVNEFVESLKGDVWPGTSGNTELTNTSIPAAKVYTGGYMNKPITDIKYVDSVISFDFMAGVMDIPQVLPATDITETSFVANWEAVEGVSEYVVEVHRVTDVQDGSGDATRLLAEDFMGCVDSNQSISDINGYVSDYGWYAENVYSEAGVLRIGSSKNAGLLETPILDVEGKVTVDFNAWLYNSKDNGVKLTATMYDASYLEIASVDIVPTATNKAYKLSAAVEYGCWIKFSTEGSTGNKRVNIDDVVISVAGSTSSEKIAEVVTGGTSYKFEGLEPGCRYAYRVKAVDVVGESAFSDYQVVDMLPTSIEELELSDGYIEVYSLSGIRLYAGNAAGLNSLPRGVYIFKGRNGVKKYMVK